MCKLIVSLSMLEALFLWPALLEMTDENSADELSVNLPVSAFCNKTLLYTINRTSNKCHPDCMPSPPPQQCTEMMMMMMMMIWFLLFTQS